jgi:xanthine dehydrogenase YagS FAD-binding subunit
MHLFAYSRPPTVDEAIRAASAPGAVFLAGGTELVNWMKERIATPASLVDINDLRDLSRIEAGADGLKVGALARMSAVASHPEVARDYPALVQALESSASQQIRNRASIGGNLLQRTRCAYFRAEVDLPCNKRVPGSGCAARDGEDRALAIFGASTRCVATHPSDLAVALVALDARVRTRSRSGSREIRVVDLYRLPGDTPEIETVLEPGELIVALDVPRATAARCSCYLKVRERASYEFALVSAAAAVDVHDGIIRSASLALGGVAPKPWPLESARNALVGLSIIDREPLHAALRADFAHAVPGRHNGFKVELAQRACVLALQRAGARA